MSKELTKTDEQFYTVGTVVKHLNVCDLSPGLRVCGIPQNTGDALYKFSPPRATEEEALQIWRAIKNPPKAAEQSTREPVRIDPPLLPKPWPWRPLPPDKIREIVGGQSRLCDSYQKTWNELDARYFLGKLFRSGELAKFLRSGSSCVAKLDAVDISLYPKVNVNPRTNRVGLNRACLRYAVLRWPPSSGGLNTIWGRAQYLAKEFSAPIVMACFVPATRDLEVWFNIEGLSLDKVRALLARGVEFHGMPDEQAAVPQFDARVREATFNMAGAHLRKSKIKGPSAVKVAVVVFNPPTETGRTLKA